MLPEQPAGGDSLFEWCRSKNVEDHARVLAVLESTPSAGDRQNANGSTPLHVLCSNDTVTLQGLRGYLALCPAAASTRNASGRVPLHLLVANAALTAKMLAAFVLAVSKVGGGGGGGGGGERGAAVWLCAADAYGHTPLHTWLQFGGPALDLNAVGAVFFDAVAGDGLGAAAAAVLEHRDGDGCLPLHHLCGARHGGSSSSSSSCSLDGSGGGALSKAALIIRYLDVCPAAGTAQSAVRRRLPLDGGGDGGGVGGDTALHYLVRQRGLDLGPLAAYLHRCPAAAANANVSTLREAALATNAAGDTPVHDLCRNEDTGADLAALLRCYFDAVGKSHGAAAAAAAGQARNAAGDTPLHLLARNAGAGGCSKLAAALRVLHGACPGACTARNRWGDTPIADLFLRASPRGDAAAAPLSLEMVLALG